MFYIYLVLSAALIPILNNFFDANYRHMIKHHSYYETLYKKRLTIEDTNINAFSEQEYSDIMALFNISWMDPCWKEVYPEIKILTEKEKKHFSIEMIFNIYENDFKDKTINDEINKHLLVYDYCYSLINNE